MAESNLAFEMRNITKRFPGVLANDDVTLDLNKGEIVALLGENGAGKSTLIKIIAGAEQPDAGGLHVARRCAFPDTRAEITAAARWARDCLEENPASRIGIIVQDLNTLRSSLIRTFDDVFHPFLNLC